MSIDFSTLQALSIPEGVVMKIEDAGGRVIWSAIEPVAGTLILRPSADISVEHGLYPSGSAAAYLLINEEVSDGTATYISTTSSKYSATSRFRLFGEPEHRITKITSITIKGEPYNESTSNDGGNGFTLYVDGIEVAHVTHTSDKSIDKTLSDGILEINEYLAKNGVLPVMDLVINSESATNTGGTKFYDTGVTQIYVVLAYEGY